MRRSLAIAVALVAACAAAPAAQARIAAKPWPPAEGPGLFFVHFGEEHWNDEDGLTLLPKVVAETARYSPDLVTMSGDKANNGSADELERWRSIMEPFDRAKIPYFAGVGNHDRDGGGLPGGLGGLGIIPNYSLGPYTEVFKSRPYPMGDAAPYADPRILPRARPSSDPAGASSHYFVDIGAVRWIFLDNSCWSLSECDPLQSPALPDREGIATQFDFLELKANEARTAGKTVFVVMHMPTRDPRDQSYTDLTAREHVMGKSETFPDNTRFEDIAQRTGVDGVFLGHIKGQFLYRGRGGIPYYIDGGAGGELYTEGPVGTDHGYWHGFRLVRVADGRVTTDSVPIFTNDGIMLRGTDLLVPGAEALFQAFGAQPVFKDPAKVEALELRDPDPLKPVEGAGATVTGFIRGGGWIFVPLLLLVLGGVAMNVSLTPARRRRAVVFASTTGVAITSLATVSLAQQSEPTTTPKEALPNPARVFTSSDPQVLAPVGSASDDPRRDQRTQTTDGRFRARCAGTAQVSVTSGYETSSKHVRVPSRGGRIVKRVRLLAPRGLRPSRSRRVVARIRLAQPARVLVKIRRRGKTVRVLKDACVSAAGKPVTVRWDGRLRRGKRLRAARPGRYAVRVSVRSDRPAIRRARTVTVLRARR